MKLFLPVFVMITIVSLGQKPSAQNKQDKESASASMTGWKLLDDKAYSIQYPESWELRQDGTGGTTFIILSKPVNAQDQFRENVN